MIDLLHLIILGFRRQFEEIVQNLKLLTQKKMGVFIAKSWNFEVAIVTLNGKTLRLYFSTSWLTHVKSLPQTL